MRKQSRRSHLEGVRADRPEGPWVGQLEGPWVGRPEGPLGRLPGMPQSRPAGRPLGKPPGTPLGGAANGSEPKGSQPIAIEKILHRRQTADATMGKIRMFLWPLGADFRLCERQ